jgi:hypothetical protein
MPVSPTLPTFSPRSDLTDPRPDPQSGSDSEGTALQDIIAAAQQITEAASPQQSDTPEPDKVLA